MSLLSDARIRGERSANIERKTPFANANRPRALQQLFTAEWSYPGLVDRLVVGSSDPALLALELRGRIVIES